MNNNNAGFAVERAVALSSVQTDIYLDATLHPNSLKNSTGYALKFDGQADLIYWQKALDLLVQSQAVLGSRLDTESEQPFLGVADTHHSLVQISAETNQPGDLLKSLIYRTYDLHSESLISHWLVQAPDCYFLVVAAHHLLLDGPSLAIHIQQFLTSAVEPEKLGFSSNIETASSGFNSEQTIDYWKTAMSQVEPVQLAGINGKSLRQSESVAIDQQQWLEVKNWCRQQKITPAFFFKCLYGWMIQYQQQLENDFAIVEIHDGRDAENRNALGCFTRQQPFVFEVSALSEAACFSDWLIAAREQQKSAKPYLKLSPSALNQLPMAADTLFAFNFNNFVPSVSHQGNQVEVQVYTPDMPNLVQLYLQDLQDHAQVELIYYQDRFIANQFLQRLIHIASQLVAGADKISEINWLLEGEINQQLPLFQPEYSDNDSLIQRFFSISKQFPKNIALQSADGQQVFSYSELAEIIEQKALVIAAQPKRSNSHLIGICMERGPQQIVAMLAIMRAGFGYVPLDPKSPAQRLQHICSDSGIGLVITDQISQKNLAESVNSVAVIDLNAVPEVNDDPRAALKSAGSECVAYVIYTSGTTGKPKGVPVDHQSVMALFDASQDVFEFTADDCWSQFHSTAFDFSIWEIWGAFLYGGKLALVPEDARQSAEVFAQWLVETEVSCLSQTPGAFKRLAPQLIEKNTCGALRHVHFGGEALELDSLKLWDIAFGLDHPRLTNLYGITETTVHVTYKPLTSDDLQQPQSRIGQPLPHLGIRLMDHYQRSVAPGIAGEIQVCGSALSQGYLNQPQLNQQKFILSQGQRWYRSGDLACLEVLPSDEAWLNKQFQLNYLGRADQQIKLRGYRIEIGEIVAELRQSELVADAAVMLVGTGEQARLVGYLQSTTDLQNSQQVIELLQKKLPQYMLPSQLIWLEQLPLTLNGKLDKAALPDPDLARSSENKADQNETVCLPQTDIERAIAKQWQQLLSLSQVSLNDHFFRLGGHSLQAAQCITELNSQFEISLPLTLIFQFPILEDLCWEIERQICEDFYLHNPQPWVLQAAIARKKRRLEKERAEKAKKMANKNNQLSAELAQDIAEPSAEQREVFEL